LVGPNRFSNLLGIECTKFYTDPFRFDIFIVRCLGGYFFPDTVYTVQYMAYVVIYTFVCHFVRCRWERFVNTTTSSHTSSAVHDVSAENLVDM